MLGNSLNPSSSVAQKMAATLNEEIETHKMFNNESNLSTSAQQNALIGPQLHRRPQKSPQKPSVRLLSYNYEIYFQIVFVYYFTGNY